MVERDRFGRRLALSVAEALPVDVRRARIDLLIHQAAREVLEPPIDLAIDERRRRRERQARRQLLQHVVTHLMIRRVRRLVLEIGADPGAKRLERVEVSQILGQLIVQRRHDALLDLFERHRIVHLTSGEIGDGIVVWVGQGELLGLADVDADHGFVEARRIRGGAELDRRLLVLIDRALDAFFVGTLALQLDDHRVAGLDDGAFDRFESRGALAQPLERLVHRFVLNGHRRTRRANLAQVARIEGGQHVEAGLEGERAAFFEHEILNVRRGHRLDAALDQRLADRLRDQIFGDVLHDLPAKSLAHDGGRHLARPESWNASGTAELGGGLADGLVDHRAWDFDHQVTACLADVYQFCFHVVGKS